MATLTKRQTIGFGLVLLVLTPIALPLAATAGALLWILFVVFCMLGAARVTLGKS